MSDSSGHRRDDSAPGEKPWTNDTKNIPPLVWVILAALVVIVAVAFFYGRVPGAGVPTPAAPASASEAAAPASGG